MTKRRTSIEAYQAILSEGLLSRLRWFVYDLLYHHGPMTGNQLIDRVKTRKNTGAFNTRLSELRDLGVVYEVGEVKDPITGRQVILWDVTEKLPKKVEKPKKRKCHHCQGRGYWLDSQQLDMF
jgi:hypothetical protein